MTLKLITDHEVKALLPHTFRYSVAILQYRNVENSRVGSGTLVQIGTHFFVATAAHNLTLYNDKCLFIGCTKERSYEQPPFKRRRPQPNEPEPDIDVGYIEISPDHAKAINEKEFLPLKRIKPFVHSWKYRVFLNGFPSEYVPKDLAQKNIFNLSAIGYLTETINPKDGSYDAKVESRDIFIDYDEIGVLVDKQSNFKMPQPYGISGGGLWALPMTSQGNLWSPQDTMLIGIERSWIETKRIALCTQIQHWLKLIADDYSDLTRCINDHLNLFLE